MTASEVSYGVLKKVSLSILVDISLFQALGSWGRAKTSERKNEGGLSLASP